MNSKPNKQQQAQKQGIIMKAIMMSGAALLIVGIYGFVQPADFIGSTGMDTQTAQILSLALITVGLGDIVAVIFLSRLKDRT